MQVLYRFSAGLYRGLEQIDIPWVTNYRRRIRFCLPSNYLRHPLPFPIISDIINLYSIRDLLSVGSVSVLHSVQRPVGLWTLFLCPIWRKLSSEACLATKRMSEMPMRFFIYMIPPAGCRTNISHMGGDSKKPLAGPLKQNLSETKKQSKNSRVHITLCTKEVSFWLKKWPAVICAASITKRGMSAVPLQRSEPEQNVSPLKRGCSTTLAWYGQH